MEILIKNTEYNKNIQCLKGGLWSSDTNLSIVNDDEWKYAIRVKEDALEGEINAFSIPGIMKMQGWDFIDILKLDIEGSEVEILSKRSELWVDKIGKANVIAIFLSVSPFQRLPRCPLPFC